MVIIARPYSTDRQADPLSQENEEGINTRTSKSQTDLKNKYALLDETSQGNSFSYSFTENIAILLLLNPIIQTILNIAFI